MTWREFKTLVEKHGITDDSVIAWIDVLGRSSYAIKSTTLRDGAVVLSTPTQRTSP
jgi:hypothetical protein